MRFPFFITVISLFLISCGNGKKYAGYYEDDKDSSQYAVIPYPAEGVWRLPAGSKPATLSEEEINEIDSSLRIAIDDHNKNPNPKSYSYSKIDSLKRYKRQLVPAINEKGEKTVWINCFCGNWGKNWRKEIIMVMDGGNCFFNLTINLTLKTWSLIQVNGYG